MSQIEDPVDRMDQIAACLRCIADLVTPGQDLHTVNREDFAVTLYFLTTEYQLARDAARAALESGPRMRVV